MGLLGLDREVVLVDETTEMKLSLHVYASDTDTKAGRDNERAALHSGARLDAC